jgi:hypothetical protein
MTLPGWTRQALRPRVSRGTITAALLLGVVSVGLLFPAVSNTAAILDGTDLHVHRTWETVNRLALDTGQIPFWNPYTWSGYPGMADIQTQVFYPPSVMLRWLPLPAFFTWGHVFHLWILGIGMFALCRQLGISRLAGFASSTGVILSGTIAARLPAGHLLVIYSYAWFPLALALTLHSARRPTFLPHPLLVGVLVVQALAGWLQGTAYVYTVIGAYFIYATVRAPDGRARWRLFGQTVVLFSLVFALAGFQLLPTLRLALDAGRMTGADYAFASRMTLSMGDFVAAVFPNALRTPDHTSLFLPLGLLACAPLAWVNRGHRRQASCALLMALAALGLAMADTFPFYRLHYALLPQFRAPTRLLFFGTVGVAVLGGFGLDTLLRRARHAVAEAGRWIAWVPAMAGGGLLVFAAVKVGGINTMAGVFGTPPSVVATQAIVLLGLGILVRRHHARLVGVGMVLLIVIEGLVFATPLVGIRDLDQPVGMDRLLAHTPSRVLSLCENAISASDLAMAGIANTDGFGGIYLDHYTRFLTLVRSGSADGEHASRLGGGPSLPKRMDLLDYLNVSHVITCEPIQSTRLTLVDRLGSTYLYENVNVKPRAGLTCLTTPRSSEAIIRRLQRMAYDASGRLQALPPQVNIRWADGLSERERMDAELRYQLVRVQRNQENTWRYSLLDGSMANIRALVSDPLTADTHGINRREAKVVPPDTDIEETLEPGMEQSLVIDGAPCEIRGTVTVAEMNLPDGAVRLTVETQEPALVFLSEPYYAERRVWVDGEEATLERVNVALSGVRVGPGIHVVELRFVPLSMYLGLSFGGVAIVGWITAARRWRPRRDRRSSSTALIP